MLIWDRDDKTGLTPDDLWQITGKWVPSQPPQILSDTKWIYSFAITLCGKSRHEKNPWDSWMTWFMLSSLVFGASEADNVETRDNGSIIMCEPQHEMWTAAIGKVSCSMLQLLHHSFRCESSSRGQAPVYGSKHWEAHWESLHPNGLWGTVTEVS